MNYNDVAIQIEKLHKEMEQKLSVNAPNNCRKPIYDGALNLEEYLQTPIKIAWMLKEAYDSENGQGGGWKYEDLFNTNEKIDTFMKSKPSKSRTWHPIIYISHCILNDFKDWNSINYIKNEPSLAYIIRQIALINAQKLPAIGFTSSSNGNWVRSFEENKLFIEKQLDILKPDVLIFGCTYVVYKNMLNFPEWTDLENVDGTRYLIRDGKVYIFTYHPAQTSISKEAYAKAIIEITKIWQKTSHHRCGLKSTQSKVFSRYSKGREHLFIESQ
jgi:hypothetical protein